MIQPEEVKRDSNGHWTHSAWDEFCNGRECVPRSEVDEWLTEHHLEICIVELEYEDEESQAFIDYFEKGSGDITAWALCPPSRGERSIIQDHQHLFGAWFLLSIHDTEDGPVQVWARETPRQGEEPTA